MPNAKNYPSLTGGHKAGDGLGIRLNRPRIVTVRHHRIYFHLDMRL